MPHDQRLHWTETFESWQPAEGELHVWRAPVGPFVPLVDRLRTHLIHEENCRADRFYFDEDRHRFLLGRLALRAAIGHCLSRRPRQLEIVSSPTGKPLLADQELHFNVSHSGEFVLVGLSLDLPVGVDVERVRPIADLQQLARRFFAPGEYRRLLQADAARREEVFFQCWTRKEAYAKCAGWGLSQGFDEFEIVMGPDGIGRSRPGPRQSVDSADCTICDLQPGAGHAGAVACAGRARTISRWELLPETVVAWLNSNSTQ